MIMIMILRHMGLGNSNCFIYLYFFSPYLVVSLATHQPALSVYFSTTILLSNLTLSFQLLCY